MSASEMDLLCINTIRTLAIDAIQKAKSGHPGTPMGMAPVAYGLWQKRLSFDPRYKSRLLRVGLPPYPSPPSQLS